MFLNYCNEKQIKQTNKIIIILILIIIIIIIIIIIK